MTTFLIVFAATGWIFAGAVFFWMRESVQAVTMKIVDDFLKTEIDPIIEKAQKNTGNVLSAHAVKLALAYADHASQVEAIQFSEAEKLQWRGRSLGAREVASAIQKSHENIYGSLDLS